MKKPSKRELFNLICSAFLVLGFGVCAYFFSVFAGSSLADNVLGKVVYLLIFVLFGLILFYATRVGDGKQIKRLNIASLVLICLPALYVLLAYLLSFMPLHEQLGDSNSVAAVLAGVAFGYGLPYSFLSGYEINDEAEEKEKAEETEKAEEAEEDSAESDEVDYSHIKTLDIEVEESENTTAAADNNIEEEKAASDNADASDDEISEDTAKTIQSILDEKTDN
ncbi:MULTISPECIES: hypothetical protein [unclassified Ruminococcus]|uniref:hypothetical protein n=1 Tax=unclassified Ruminococcus TaxID=2608920 RepID=UPI00210E3C32|nr:MULTISPECIES: hypothetical protein [unclassified Ruminococcus]MCQ4021913.1 hypothetical protein [Ruminococcus sp. zg-924]MCQ4115649.1 hypothetical protein [Ruminococcus sp. zg-921]